MLILEMVESRRLKNLMVTPEALVTLMKSGERHFKVTENAIPEDARVVGGGLIPGKHWFVITIQSEEFDEVPEGDPIPAYEPLPVFESLPLTESDDA